MGKVIFLDFEGPLINVKTPDYVFDKESVRQINDICQQTGAKIVCTSQTARVQSPFERSLARKKFAHAGLDLGHLHEDWSCMFTMMRRKEEQIGIWLESHPETTHFVVVDDLLMDDFPNSVQAHRHWGLKPAQFGEISGHLTGESNYFPPKSLSERFKEFKNKPVFRLLAGGKLVTKPKTP